jgi:hypothetical protein
VTIAISTVAAPRRPGDGRFLDDGGSGVRCM